MLTSWQIDGETVETVTDFIFLGSKITADGDCSHEIKRHLLLGRKAMTNLNSIFKSRDITLPTTIEVFKDINRKKSKFNANMTSVIRPVKPRVYLESSPPCSHRGRPEIWQTLELCILRFLYNNPSFPLRSLHCSEWGWETPGGGVWVCTGVQLSL